MTRASNGFLLAVMAGSALAAAYLILTCSAPWVALACVGYGINIGAAFQERKRRA